MKNNKKSKRVKKTAPLTKSLGELIKDEDGFVSKETILKVGLSTVAALGMTGALTDMGQAGHYNNTHSNYVDLNPPDNCATHHNITTHTY